MVDVQLLETDLYSILIRQRNHRVILRTLSYDEASRTADELNLAHEVMEY